jgi:hypothetical protein
MYMMFTPKSPIELLVNAALLGCTYLLKNRLPSENYEKRIIPEPDKNGQNSQHISNYLDILN